MLRAVAALFKVSTKNLHLGTFSKPRPCAPLVMIDEETFVHALLGNFSLFFLVLSLNFLSKNLPSI